MDQYSIPVFVRRNQGFRLPRRVATPIIMVGPGTGLAPFRGFIQHRAALKAEGKEVGENVLFFGCRHQDKDFLYSDELYQYADEGTIQLYTAFSRDTVSENMTKLTTHLCSVHQTLAHALAEGSERVQTSNPLLPSGEESLCAEHYGGQRSHDLGSPRAGRPLLRLRVSCSSE